MDTNKMREQFEAAFVEEMVARCGEGFRSSVKFFFVEKEPDGTYSNPIAHAGWWAWQASREAVVVELPKVVGFEGAYDSHRHHEFVPSMIDVEDADEIFGLCRRVEAKEAIEALGLKVAP
ncbi:hypothetical protein [Pseudomonas sp. p106]|uniref:hypothetical protein n=1 Tax=Pseudomonas sp. p106 TaxID=2479854 RepID=UPI000F77D8F4|nr:hypothetical protein [Pseudomonas sp. p106]RRV49560.1 hypothetical protein EGJ09_01085 [Pseudomonas sp. p106]